MARLFWAHLRGLEAAEAAAFWMLDGWLVGSLFVPLCMPQVQLFMAVKIQEVSPKGPAFFVHSTPVLLY